MSIAVRAPQRGANLMAVYSPPGNPVNWLRLVISRTPRSLTHGARTRPGAERCQQERNVWGKNKDSNGSCRSRASGLRGFLVRGHTSLARRCSLILEQLVEG
jgi:hypothetical protein